MESGPEEPHGLEPLQVALLASHPVEPTDLLALGRGELKNAINEGGWRQPKLPTAPDFSLHPADCYRYHLRPPTVLGTHPRDPIPHWDSHLASKVVLYVPQLEIFDPQLSMNRQSPQTQPTPEVEWFTLIPKAGAQKFI